jgi:hypothetical protein
MIVVLLTQSIVLINHFVLRFVAKGIFGRCLGRKRPSMMRRNRSQTYSQHERSAPMSQKPVNDPYQAENQGLPHGSKLDSDPAEAGCGWGSFQNGKKSPERQKVQRLDVHGDSKRKS